MVGLHFFDTAPTLLLVELVETLVTDRQVALRAERFLVDVLGKQVVRSRDGPGFLVNALLIPYLLSAVRMVESGFASATVTSCVAAVAENPALITSDWPPQEL